MTSSEAEIVTALIAVCMRWDGRKRAPWSGFGGHTHGTTTWSSIGRASEQPRTPARRMSYRSLRGQPWSRCPGWPASFGWCGGGCSKFIVVRIDLGCTTLRSGGVQTLHTRGCRLAAIVHKDPTNKYETCGPAQTEIDSRYPRFYFVRNYVVHGTSQCCSVSFLLRSRWHTLSHGWNDGSRSKL